MPHPPFPASAVTAEVVNSVYQVSLPWFFIGWTVIAVSVIVALILFLFAILLLGRWIYFKVCSTPVPRPPSTSNRESSVSFQFPLAPIL